MLTMVFDMHYPLVFSVAPFLLLIYSPPRDKAVCRNDVILSCKGKRVESSNFSLLRCAGAAN